jgi:hypothetical protein
MKANHCKTCLVYQNSRTKIAARKPMVCVPFRISPFLRISLLALFENNKAKSIQVSTMSNHSSNRVQSSELVFRYHVFIFSHIHHVIELETSSNKADRYKRKIGYFIVAM